MFRIFRASLILTLVFVATGAFASSALAATGSFYVYDPSTGEPRYDAPYVIEDGGTVAVPFNTPGFIEIDIDLEPFLFPDGEVFVVAYNAPLMQAIMGLHIGDSAETTSPQGPVEYEVLALFASWDDVPVNLRNF